MKAQRNKTRVVNIGGVKIGGNNPVAVQSMAKTITADVRSTVAQIKRLEKINCEIIRVGVPDMAAALCLGKIKKQINIPLVADIHFQWQLAIEAINQGVDKIRINPGNMAKDKLAIILERAKARKIAIRIGVNSGSLKSLHENKKADKASLMVNALADYIRFFENAGFRNIVISLKATDVPATIKAYRIAAQKFDYPLHLGITEAGVAEAGIIKSSVGIGTLLAEGIGDTIRVSLTSEPEEEIKTAYAILQSLNLRNYYPEIISCPTCSRAQVDVITLANRIYKEMVSQPQATWKLPLKIAIMGCVVNGPGEAREADFGLAGGRKEGLLFRRGKIVSKIKEKDFYQALQKEIAKWHR
ncbi:MAG: flavodoxin-dependent (E)-4-hydroxy-3-methylbut-2-enyl-diphosphate synthase [bacterium]|nr:flavodoxin-dependent (E)-4-hydroxy-3-methylbut-2-enyl-diphosphate synthase [bacterium]